MNSSLRHLDTMNAFKIVLCGLFQTGKSTTLNALADGREICAQSSTGGIRTSACNTYIYGSTQEKCQLELINDYEICFKLSRVLDYRVKPIDLWQFQQREMLWHRLIHIWQNEESNPEQIEEASLLLSGLGFLPSLRRDFQNTSVKYVSWFGKAPEDELIRWSKFRNSVKQMSLTEFKHLLRDEFPIQEVLYPFVKNIVVQLNIMRLKTNNICIIDTPGLSVNSNDTATALHAVNHADAIVYILGGNKEPGEFERQFLCQLHSILKNRPIIFAVNCQQKEHPNVIKTINEVLKICGYNNTPFVVYNAALSLRKAQGIKLMEPHPLRSLVKDLISKAHSEGFSVSNAAQAWSLLTAKDMSVVSQSDSEKIDKLGLCTESMELLKDHSQLLEIICNIKC